MPFSTYMLHCRGGYFYVGHTDDLERRVAQHQSGQIPGFTEDHLPVALAWSQEFVSREEAKASEDQIKGWSRAKKMALIRGDWKQISLLAKSKDSPSTSSGKTGTGNPEIPSKTAYPELVEGLSFTLQPHPQAPPNMVSHISGRVRLIEPHWLKLRWRIEDSSGVVIPNFAGKGRADGLWQTTCFELFVMSGKESGYVEINLSPSERWAAYNFGGYREGMSDRPMPRDPACTLRRGRNLTIFDAAVPLAGLPQMPWDISMTAVIEETCGTKSYWALAHPPGKPDFHHPDCFALTLEAPDVS